MFRIYLSGGMKKLTYEQQTIYRNHIMKTIYSHADAFKEKVHIFNPVDFFNYEIKRHKTEKQTMLFELNEIRRSDLVVVYFNVPYSIGTAYELTVPSEHRIPIIGANLPGIKLHPWNKEVCDVIFEDTNEAIDYIEGYYLV